MKFEDRLRDSAKRMMEEENGRLVVPKNPRGLHKTTHWGWIATPAAAVVGVLFGMSLPMMNNTQEDTGAVAQLRDTIFLENDFIDTVFITKTVVKEKRVKVYVNSHEAGDIAKIENVDTFDIESQCTSIACDGIDYAFFRRER
jgi:hypothetical protein